ncbi:hypothetical protein CQW23_31306 [Capsicum baccatum]|uniref:Uncharacterized protein n=1 Tax=Capsicum baccatum TaxID=33114 RepID=A0A2G2V825_CAPBA|nr:hypothetical protein CQW23_31306 [Capsicum baccatum]
MVQEILQFTPSIAFRNVLYRCKSREFFSFTEEAKVPPKHAADGARGEGYRFKYSLALSALGFVGRPPARASGMGGGARAECWSTPPARTTQLLNTFAGSPTETLLRLLLPLNDKVQWTSCDVAGSEPPTSTRSKHFTGSFNRLPEPVGQGFKLVEYISVVRFRPRTSKGITDLLLPQTSAALKSVVPLRSWPRRDTSVYLVSRLRSRSLTKLTIQIAPPTKNGHAPPPIESRKSSQSVNPYYVWTWGADGFKVSATVVCKERRTGQIGADEGPMPAVSAASENLDRRSWTTTSHDEVRESWDVREAFRFDPRTKCEGRRAIDKT